MNQKEYLKLLSQREALLSDAKRLNAFLMQAETSLTANSLAELISKLHASVENITELLLTVADLSDKVEGQEISTIVDFNNKSIITLKKESKYEN